MPEEQTFTQEAVENIGRTLENQQPEMTDDEKIVESVRQTLEKNSEGEQKPAEEQKQAEGKKPEEQKPAEEKKQEEPPKPKQEEKPAEQPEKPADQPEKPAEEKKPDFLADMDKAFEQYASEKRLGDDEWDKFMDGIKAMRDELVSLREMRDKMKEYDAYIGRKQEEEDGQRLEAMIDSAFDSLGEEFAAQLGRGSASKLDKAFLDNRNAILEKANIFLLGSKEAGKEMTLDEAIAQAAKLWAVDNMKPVAPRPAQSRTSQFTQPPASQRSTLEKSEEAAIEMAARKMKEYKQS